MVTIDSKADMGDEDGEDNVIDATYYSDANNIMSELHGHVRSLLAHQDSKLNLFVWRDVLLR